MDARMEGTGMPAVDVTSLLAAASDGDPAALDRALPLIYDDLRRQAERLLRRERADHTLQPTALVHEAYLRLVDQTRVDWQSRGHFLAVAAIAMRRILVNHAKAKGRLKRGGGGRRVDLDQLVAITGATDPDLVALDEALTRLADIDARKVRVVEMRFFAGLSIEETAEALAIAPATVKRDWTMAKAWLLREMTSSNGRDDA
jgi:RNA polymerase sigma factor (TIGR02999 family)